MKLFQHKCTIGLDYSHLKDTIKFITRIELIPLRINGDDYEHYPAVPNAYGLYLRYNKEGIDNFNLNPCEWLVDFDTEEAAISFKLFIESFINVIHPI